MTVQQIFNWAVATSDTYPEGAAKIDKINESTFVAYFIPNPQLSFMVYVGQEMVQIATSGFRIPFREQSNWGNWAAIRNNYSGIVKWTIRNEETDKEKDIDFLVPMVQVPIHVLEIVNLSDIAYAVILEHNEMKKQLDHLEAIQN